MRWAFASAAARAIWGDERDAGDAITASWLAQKKDGAQDGIVVEVGHIVAQRERSMARCKSRKQVSDGVLAKEAGV